MHAGAVEAEVTVLLEKCLGGRVVLMAGHDEPVERLPVAFACGHDLFGEHLEQGMMPDRSDRKCSLGPVKPEARPLSAGDRECRDASGAKRRFAGRPRLRPGFRADAAPRQVFVGRRLEAG